MKRALAICSLLVSVLIGLWLWSGREIWTKTGVPFDEERRDIMGEVQIVKVMRPGPLGGYYLGLDIVALAVIASLVVIAGVWIVRRVRSRSQGVADHAS